MPRYLLGATPEEVQLWLRFRGPGGQIGNLSVTVAWLLPIRASGKEPEPMAEAHAARDPFEALGDPHRRDILRLLSDGDKPVREIADALPISRPAVSRHLRLLKEAGLVAEQAPRTP